MMVMVTTLLFMGVVANVFLVARAKLEAQNLADAAALAVAAMEAKCLNVVVDRNEWMNHLYAKPANGPDPNTASDGKKLPPISLAHQWRTGYPGLAREYARLVRTVNQTQILFIEAYNRFIGAGAGGGVSSQNSGANSLSEILDEISGLKEGNVQVVVWNHDGEEPSPEDYLEKDKTLAPERVHVDADMRPLEFDPVAVEITVEGRKRTLRQEYGGGADKEIGWMRLTWDKSPKINVTLPGGKPSKEIGARAMVIKRVKSYGIPLATKNVVAISHAYIVPKSGDSGIKRSGGGLSASADKPPYPFRPTYYVQLGNK